MTYFQQQCLEVESAGPNTRIEDLERVPQINIDFSTTEFPARSTPLQVSGVALAISLISISLLQSSSSAQAATLTQQMASAVSQILPHLSLEMPNDAKLEIVHGEGPNGTREQRRRLESKQDIINALAGIGDMLKSGRFSEALSILQSCFEDCQTLEGEHGRKLWETLVAHSELALISICEARINDGVALDHAVLRQARKIARISGIRDYDQFLAARLSGS